MRPTHIDNLLILGVLLGIFGTFWSVFSMPIFAQAATSAVSISPTNIVTQGAASDSAKATDSAQIRTLRDRLASVVAEMRKKDQKVVAGDLKSLSGSTLELETVFGTIEKAQIDDALTKFYRIKGVATEEIKKEDIKGKLYLIVTGPHLDGVITANEIYIDEHFESRSGRVTEVNASNFTFKLETFEKDTLSVNVEKSTSQEILNIKNSLIEPGGFSRITEGDIAHVVYSVTSIKDQKTNVTPIRVFIVPAGYFLK